MRTLLPAERVLPGDIIHGTWSATYPEPVTVENIEYAPEHSNTGHAFRLALSDRTQRVYYGDCKLDIERT